MLVLQTEQEDAPSFDQWLKLDAERVDFTRVRDPRIWMEDADKAMIPQQGMQAVVKWLSEVYP